MVFALIALFVAAAAAGWLLLRVARDDDARGAKPVTTFKVVVWLALSAALLAAKLWPLAFMVLIAAGGVSAIEAWRAKSAVDDEPKPPAPLTSRMSATEALNILGLEAQADADAVRAAHRRLISQLHPDKGGTDYLAAKINDARDFLLDGLE